MSINNFIYTIHDWWIEIDSISTKKWMWRMFNIFIENSWKQLLIFTFVTFLLLIQNSFKMILLDQIFNNDELSKKRTLKERYNEIHAFILKFFKQPINWQSENSFHIKNREVNSIICILFLILKYCFLEIDGKLLIQVFTEYKIYLQNLNVWKHKEPSNFDSYNMKNIFESVQRGIKKFVWN